ncbi:MAG: tRNA (N6-threonylcarbamoyladenosine(37)-N6)-methyltransferase TrmO [Archaeoglobaceae archaeon]
MDIDDGYDGDNISIELKPIGYVQTDASEVPRHFTISDVEGKLIINEEYLEGMKDIKPGEQIVVIFHFHKSPQFNPSFLRQTPPHRGKEYGVFSICSPMRPNPIGLSILEVLDVKDNIIRVKRLDMLDGTPILDIKPDVR